MGFKKLMRQLLKFGVVGVVAFAIDYGVLMLLSQALGMDPILSAAISFTLSIVFNYVASMRYVFTHRADISRRREFVIFVILSAIGLAVNELCMWGGTALLGKGALEVTFTKLFSTAVVMIWNFFSRKRWLDGGGNAG